MVDAPRPPTGAWRTYLELASGLGETSRKQVRKVVKDLVGKGNATAEQLRTMSSELLAANTVNREALAKLVKVEVDRALGRVGLATMDEVNELTARVRDLERQLRQARTATPAATPTATRPTKAATAATTAVVKKATRKAVKGAAASTGAPAKAAKKATKAAPAKATTAKAAPAKATRRTAP